jgi:hypothetical protein
MRNRRDSQPASLGLEPESAGESRPAKGVTPAKTPCGWRGYRSSLATRRRFPREVLAAVSLYAPFARLHMAKPRYGVAVGRSVPEAEPAKTNRTNHLPGRKLWCYYGRTSILF